MASDTAVVIEFEAKADSLNSEITKSISKIDKLKTHYASISPHLNSINVGVGKALTSTLKWGAAASAVYGSFVAIKTIALAAWVDSVAGKMDELNDKAMQLGVSGNSLKTLNAAGSLSGVADAAPMIKALNRSIGELIQGEAVATEGFKKLGLSAKDLQGLAIEDQISKISTALGQVSDKQMQAAIAQEIAMKGSAALLTMTRDGVQENIEWYNKLGLAITDYERKAIDLYNDSKGKLGLIWDAFGEKVVAKAAPTFARILEFVEKTVSNMGGMDAAAQKFADAIVSGVTQAINAIAVLIDSFNSVQKGMLFVGDMINKRDVRKANYQIEDENTRQATAKNLSYVYERQQKSFIPGIGGQFALADANSNIEKNHTRFNEISKSQDDRKNWTNQLRDTLKTPDFILPAVTDITELFEGSATKIREEMKAAEESAKAAATNLNGIVKQSGQTEISRILGLNSGKQEEVGTNSEDFDEQVKAIYRTALTGQSLGGVSNEKQLARLEAQYSYADDDDTAGNIIARAGVINELKDLLKSVDPKQNKINLGVEITAGDGFVAKIIQDDAMKAMMNTTVTATLRNAAKGVTK